MAIQADPSSFIVELTESLKGFRGSNDWLDQLRAKDNVKEESNK